MGAAATGESLCSSSSGDLSRGMAAAPQTGDYQKTALNGAPCEWWNLCRGCAVDTRHGVNVATGLAPHGMNTGLTIDGDMRRVQHAVGWHSAPGFGGGFGCDFGRSGRAGGAALAACSGVCGGTPLLNGSKAASGAPAPPSALLLGLVSAAWDTCSAPAPLARSHTHIHHFNTTCDNSPKLRTLLHTGGTAQAQ